MFVMPLSDPSLCQEDVGIVMRLLDCGFEVTTIVKFHF